MRFSLSLSALTTASEAGVKDLDSPEHDKCCGFRNAEVRKTQVYVLAPENLRPPTPASLSLARAESC